MNWGIKYTKSQKQNLQNLRKIILETIFET